MKASEIVDPGEVWDSLRFALSEGHRNEIQSTCDLLADWLDFGGAVPRTGDYGFTSDQLRKYLDDIRAALGCPPHAY